MNKNDWILIFVTFFIVLLAAKKVKNAYFSDNAAAEDRYACVAEKDITAYELWQCMRAMEMMNKFHQDPKAVVDGLEPSVKRHFRKQP